MNISAIENLQQAFAKAMSIRPKVGGFPVLAETLRRAGVTKNVWNLPGCQSMYYTTKGTLVQQGQPLVSGFSEVPDWNEEALIEAIRRDQAGESEFSEFLTSTWQAGVVSYVVDFEARTCTYFGSKGEAYCEEYMSVDLTEPYELV